MRKTILTMLAVTAALCSPFLALADEAATAAGWSEAVLASRAKIQAQLAGRVAPATTGVMKGSMPAVKLEYDLTGAKELWLVVVSDPNYDYGQAVWGEPELVAADGGIVKLIDLKPVEAKTGWGSLQINKNVAGGPLKIAGAPIAYGFLAHSDSLVRFNLDKPYKTIRTKVGIDDVAGTNGHVRFVISSYDPNGIANSPIVAEINGKYPGLAALTRKHLTSTLDGAGLRAAAIQFMTEQAIKDLPLQLQLVNPAALRRALDDLAATTPDRYPDAAALRQQIAAIPADLKTLAAQALKGDAAAGKQMKEILALQSRILLANPLLDFDKVLAIKRGRGNMGLPANFNSNSSIGTHGYDNEIVELSLHGKVPVRTIHKPQDGRFVGDLSIHFDANRLLLSMPNDKRQWQVFEIKTDGSGLRQITPDLEAGLGNYDACYLPDGDILYTSTTVMVGVPCVTGSSHVANLFRISADGQKTRQLCFDQEHNWTPRVMPNGTILYQRWEYTDTPHANTRLLFTMNPDGTNQREFYGSNSYWPTAFFYAMPVPGKPSQVVGISTGHHGPARTGELIILDVAKGRREGSGVVQKIPGFGQKYEAKIYDHMDDVWPDFLHPCPLSDKYFLAACQPSPQHKWGIYLVDIFDNLQLIQEFDGYAMLEPVALVKRPVPPVIADKTDPKRRDAIVYLQNIYEGPGLQGIPPGTVKSLRIFSYTFSYHGVGGLYGVIGQDGPWDLKRVLGTVPVYPDGSAKFRVPSNVPIAIQPLDENGQALALMRSWMTAMPGEVLSCIGCHETENMAPPARITQAFKKDPSEIAPWRPMVSGFSFDREVQPVLDKYCVSCHNDEGASPDLRGGIKLKGWSSVFSGNGGGAAGRFTTSYSNLFPFVRNNGIEGDYHLLAPMEFHFSTSELGKMLRKGHHGVKLDADAFDRLVVWDDMNRPYHGSWSSIVGTGVIARETKRAELRKRYANVDENHEAQPPPSTAKIEPVIPEPEKPIINPEITLAGWPFDAAQAKTLQGEPATMPLDLGNGMTLELVKIPAGEFVMGSAAGHRDEQPISQVKIKKAFWMGRLEITNAQFRAYDPTHDSRVADALSYQFGQRPFSLNEDKQPVCRISWREAMNYCQWLAKKTGKKVTLPTEAQWEWACRAGSADAYSFGQNNADYAPFANFGDKSLSKFVLETAHNGYHGTAIHQNPPKTDDYIPKDSKHDDGNQLAAASGSYKPNAWGLHDMHGNVAEWTRSLYQPYPYKDDARNDAKPGTGERVVRGGSWWVRPFQCTSSWRIPYQDYQPVMDVGFRIIVEE